MDTTDESDDFFKNTKVKRIKALKSRKNNVPAKKAVISKKISPKIAEKNTVKSRKKAAPSSNTSPTNISPKNTTIRKKRTRKINTEDSENNFTSPNTEVVRNNILPLNKTIIRKNRNRKINSLESVNKFTSPNNTEVPRNNISPLNKTTINKKRKRKISSEESEESVNNLTSPTNSESSRSNDSPIIHKNKKRRYNIKEPEYNFTSPNSMTSLNNTPISKNKKRKEPENNFTPPNNNEMSENNRTPLANNTTLNNTPRAPNQTIRQNYIIISPLKSTTSNEIPRRDSSTPSSCESMTHTSPSTPKNTDKGNRKKRHKENSCDTDGNIIPPNYVLIKRMEPQHRNRLFYKILKAKVMELVVQNWLNEYKIDHEKGLREIYQLFIDIASFQLIDINDFLDQELNEIDNIVKHMISVKNIVVLATQKYFLYFRGHSYMKKRERIEAFIELFVETCAREKMMYDFHLFNKLIHFIVLFANSDIRCIRHTGVYLGLKFQTGLVSMEALIIRKVYKYQKALENESDSSDYDQIKSKIAKLKNYDDEMNSMITNLQLHVFSKNCNLLDQKMWKMRLECLEELYKWIQIFPGRHLHNENISYLEKAMIKDINREVRYKAIEITGKLIENYSGILKLTKIPKLIENIAQRVRDVEIKVAALAIETLSKIRKVANLPSSVREILCKYIFSPKYTVAAASGKYLAEVIKEKSKDDDESLAIMLLNFEKKCNQRDIFQHQYLIEALYDYLPISIDISPFITIYKHFDLDEELTTIWVNVVTEIMHITFFGKSSAARHIQNRAPTDVNVPIADRMYIVMWRFLNEINDSGGDVKIFLPIFYAMKGYQNAHPDIARLLQDLARLEAEENYKIEPIDSEINNNTAENENTEQDIVIKMEIE